MSPPGTSPAPAARSRTGAAIVGVALAAASAGLATWSTHARPSPLVVANTTTVAASGQGAPLPSSPGPGVPAALTLPDPVLHPGVVDANRDSAELCAAGFTTKSIRPPVSYTDRLKVLELGDGGTITAPDGTIYMVAGEHLPGAVSDYELDHLVSLELGGDPNDPKNLWLEPWERKGNPPLAPAGQGAESKDVVENRLHREVCNGALTLAQAQQEIMTNWKTAQ